MALLFLEQMLHPGEETTSTLSLQQFLQKSLPMVPYVCIFHQGEEDEMSQMGKLYEVSGTSREKTLCTKKL